MGDYSSQEEEDEFIISSSDGIILSDSEQKKFQVLPDEVKHKYCTLRLKNELIYKSFAVIPKTESVVQDYFCHLNGFYGRLYITQNYILFYHDDEKICVPFGQVSEVKREKAGLFHLFNTAISVKEKDGSFYYFSNFFRCENCYVLLNYLFCYPPAVFSIVKRRTTNSLSLSSSPSDFHSSNQNNNNNHHNNNNNHHHNHHGNGRDDEEEDRNHKLASYDEKEQRMSMIISGIKEEKYDVMPDVNIAVENNKLAEEIFGIGVSTRFELENQAKQIDLIERNIDETNQHLKETDRHIKGIQSVAGSIVGKIEGAFDKGLGVYEAPDRSAGDQEREIYFDVPILVKHKNCALQPALLKFGSNGFFCCDPYSAAVMMNNSNNNNEKKKGGPSSSSVRRSDDRTRYPLIRDYNYRYNEVAFAVVRVRPLHVDIRFEKRDRFRCVSAYVQSLINEIFLRCDRRIEIRFEFGVPKFSFGHESIRNHSLKSTRDIAVRDSVFEVVRPKEKITENLIVNATPVVAERLDMQDDEIDKLGKHLSKISVNADDIGNELQRQTSQLNRMNMKVDKAIQQSHYENYQVNNMNI